MRRICGACNGERYIDGNQCRVCGGTGEETVSREHIYFTLYELESMRNKTLAEVEARCLDHIPHRFVRIEVTDEGDGLEIKDAQFIDREVEEREAKNARDVLDTMRQDMNGEIEG